MDKPVDVGTNAMFSVATWFLPSVLTFLVTPWMVHGLGPSQYGIYALVLGVTGAIVGLMSPTRAVTRQIATRPVGADRENATFIRAATTATLALGLALALALALSATALVDTVFRISEDQIQEVVRALLISAVAIPIMMTGHVLGSVSQGFQRFDLHGRVALCMSTLLVVGNGVLALLGATLTSLLLWSVAVAMVASLAHLCVAKRLVPSLRFGPSLTWLPLLPHLGFSAGVLTSQAPGHVLLLLERTWLVRVMGAPALTYYVVPMTLGLSLHAAMASLGLVLFPVASKVFAEGDMERLGKVYKRALKFAATLIALAVVSLLACGTPLLELWLGSDFAERSALPLAFHACAFGVLALTVVPWHLCEALGKPSWNAVLALSWLVINAILLVVLTPKWGIAGAAAARLAGMSLFPLYEARLERQLFGNVQWKFWLRLVSFLAFAGLVSGAAQRGLLHWLPLHWWSLGLAVGVGSAGFAGTLWASGFFTRSDINWFAARLSVLRREAV